jgi:hypothetical protein
MVGENLTGISQGCERAQKNGYCKGKVGPERNNHAMKTYGGAQIKLHALLFSTSSSTLSIPKWAATRLVRNSMVL